MGLGAFLKVAEDWSEVETAGRYIPLKRIRGIGDLGLLFADIVPLLHLGDVRSRLQAVQYSVSEMVRNVLEHSRSDDGAVVSAALYPATGERQAHVSIGIADCGIGIRAGLGANFPRLVDDGKHC